MDKGGEFVKGIVFNFEIKEGNDVLVDNGEKKEKINEKNDMVEKDDFKDKIGEKGKIIVYKKINKNIVEDDVNYKFKSVEIM